MGDLGGVRVLVAVPIPWEWEGEPSSYLCAGVIGLTEGVETLLQ